MVASGVLSRGPSPVPPVVKITSTRRESASSRNWLRNPAGSSEHRSADFTSQPNSLQRLTNSGPDTSSRSPRETESLMVRIETRIPGLNGGVFNVRCSIRGFSRKRFSKRVSQLDGTSSRLASSINRIASISKPVVFRVVVVRGEALPALKSISNSPSVHKITL
jgi:hypothetical protein